jgi:hypothetical protein
VPGVHEAVTGRLYLVIHEIRHHRPWPPSRSGPSGAGLVSEGGIFAAAVAAVLMAVQLASVALA